MQDKNMGYIHSFESLGALDGPGIRFVIFMQGCHMKCKYCQNRDTWPTNCGKQYSTDEVIHKILKYKNYFIASNGGVTFSGGEPLLQPKFLIDVCTRLKQENINVTIDTSGNLELTEDIKKVIDLADLFLLDIKCINEEICKDLIGFSNKKELAFAKYLSENNKEMWIRQVLVPGYTDKKEDLEKLKEFIKSLKTVEKVEILPYHDMGKHKWKELGLKYELENVKIPTEEDVENAKKILGI